MNKSDRESQNFETILEDLFHPNPNINKKAISIIKKNWRKDFLTILLRNLQSNDVILRRKSVVALGELGESIFCPIVELYLTSENDTIRTSCLKVLIKVVVNNDLKDIPVEVISLIDLAIQNDSPEIILTVTSLLKEIGSEGLNKLMKCCQDKNILRAKAALSALLEINDPSVKQFLTQLAQDKSIDSMIREDLLTYYKD